MTKAPDDGHGGTGPPEPRMSADQRANTDIDFSNILKMIQQPVFVVDQADRIVFTNDLCLKLWQSDPLELQDCPTLAEFLTSLFLTGRFPPVRNITTEAEFRVFLKGYLDIFKSEEFSFADMKVQDRHYRITCSMCGPHRVFSHADVTEQVLAKREAVAAREKAEAQRSQMSQVFEALPHSAVLLDQEMTIQQWNQRFLEVMELTSEDLADHPKLDEILISCWRRGFYLNQFPPDQEDALRAELETRREALFAGRRSQKTIKNDPSCGAADKVFLAESVPIDGGVMLTQVDVTPLEVAREQAEAERNRLSQVFEALPHSAVLLDHDLSVIQYNQKFLDFVDMTRDDLVGQPHFEELLVRLWRRGAYMTQFRPDQEDELRAHLLKARQKVLYSGDAHKLYKADPTGAGRDQVFLAKAVQLDQGIMLTHVDITPLEAARKQAETERNRMSQIIEALPHSAVLVDRDLRVLLYNARFLDMMHLRPEDVSEEPNFNELAIRSWRRGGYSQDFAPDQEDELRAALTNRQETVLSGMGPRQTTFTNPQDKSQDMSFLVESVPIDDGFMVTHVDVTSVEDARIKAEAADKAKSAFLANMSHEIRTPMNGIVGMCEILASTKMTEEQRLCTRTISDSSMALLNIINDILDFSKIEADKLSLHPEPFSLYDVTYDIASLLARDAGRKGLEVCVDYDQRIATGFLGDPGRIRQVLVNIAGNAIKFTQSGYVLISIRHNADQGVVQIAIQDTGVGIPQERLGSIFSAFEQVDNESTRAFEGTGLGLAITDRLVRMMDGSIDVTSEPGRGSTFTVTLPMPVADVVTAQPPNRTHLDGLSVLVVDDLLVNRTILQKRLTRMGATVLLADSVAAARTMIVAQTNIHLGIIDYQMPEENGADFMKWLCAEQGEPAFPSILLSSVDQTWNKAEMLQIGFADVLVKPARNDLLINSISRVLHKPGAAAVVGQKVSAADEIPDLTGISILIAEDNRTNRLVITKMLEPTNAELMLCPDGRQTVDHYANHYSDVVLMDISMPVLNGLEAAREIRAFEAEYDLPRCPIIALTANAMQHHIDEAMTSGMDDFLSKPVRKRDLMAALTRCLDASREQRKSA